MTPPDPAAPTTFGRVAENGGAGRPADDDALDDLGTDATPLDDLVTELTAELADESTFPVPGRPGYQVTYNTGIDHNLLAVWRKKAADRTMPDNIDEMKWACTILASQCVRVLRNGDPVRLDNAEATFRTPAFQRLLGVGRAVDLVRKFYGADAHVLAAAEAVLGEAGYGTQMAKEDPTQRS